MLIRRSHTPGSVVLAGALFISYAYFYQAGGWNQNSRFDLVAALVERGTVRIDAYADNTGDKTVFGGHVYSDKAPGQAIAGLPVVAVGTLVARVVGADALDATTVAILSYTATVWAAGVPTVFAAVCLAWSARRLGASAGAGMFVALAYGLASPAWVYATLFWGHALAAGCLAVAFAAAIALRDDRGERRDAWLGLLVGLTAAWAVVTEYPSAPAAAILTALAVAHASVGVRHRAWRVAGWVGTAAVAGLLVLAIYDLAAFGSPVRLSYEGVQGFAGMSDGLFGITFPKRTVLQEIVLGQFRGLLPLTPVLALAPVGLVLLWRQPANRCATAASAAIGVYYLLFNASYYYWTGGFSYGPRHLGAALPFMFFGLGQVWTIAGRTVRGMLGVLATYGIGLSVIAVSTLVMLPEDVSAPVRQLLVPAFLHGDLAQNRQSFVQYGSANPAQGLPGAWNVGQLVGLPGLVSLVPLCVFWLAVVLVLRRTCAVRGSA
ncbi:MAG: hypothetical protein LC797_19160 [Chloroflexi bacterium]|nr:hypothetical protein [Chloroflexota bacterium]